VPPLMAKAIAENLHKAPFMAGVNKPTVISTFAGCGGSSLGYQMAGFKELLAVEWDDNAVATFKLNFPDVPVYHGDIHDLTAEHCCELAGIQPGELDVFDGSPPCQGFSTAGKRKLTDPRNGLAFEFVRLLEGLRPKAFVMENVTGLIKGAMKRTYLTITQAMRDAGYKGQVLNAMYYGVPQSRERVIVVGVREDLGIEPGHPKPQTKAMAVGDAVPELRGKRILSWRYKGGRDTLRPVGALPTGITRRGVPLEGRIGYMDPAGIKTLFSFPAGFQLGSGHQMKQLANSVPPLLMKAIAGHVCGLLEATGEPFPEVAHVPRETAVA